VCQLVWWLLGVAIMYVLANVGSSALRLPLTAINGTARHRLAARRVGGLRRAGRRPQREAHGSDAALEAAGVEGAGARRASLPASPIAAGLLRDVQ
jgi:hypothetical protein